MTISQLSVVDCHVRQRANEQRKNNPRNTSENKTVGQKKNKIPWKKHENTDTKKGWLLQKQLEHHSSIHSYSYRSLKWDSKLNRLPLANRTKMIHRSKTKSLYTANSTLVLFKWENNYRLGWEINFFPLCGYSYFKSWKHWYDFHNFLSVDSWKTVKLIWKYLKYKSVTKSTALNFWKYYRCKW